MKTQKQSKFRRYAYWEWEDLCIKRYKNIDAQRLRYSKGPKVVFVDPVPMTDEGGRIKLVEHYAVRPKHRHGNKDGFYNLDKGDILFDPKEFNAYQITCLRKERVYKRYLYPRETNEKNFWGYLNAMAYALDTWNNRLETWGFERYEPGWAYSPEVRRPSVII